MVIINGVFQYDPDTGEFSWAVNRRGTKKGDRAGSAHGGTGAKQYRVMCDGEWASVHHLIWEHYNGKVPEGMCVSHSNGDGLDNRLFNLELTTKADSNRNRKLYQNNTSGIVGVHLHKPTGKWCAKVCGKHLGLFSSMEVAAERVSEYRKTHGFGEKHGTQLPC